MKIERHRTRCHICKSPDCKEIEADYINGLSLRELEVKYNGISTMSLWTHFNAFPAIKKKRSDNTLAILGRIIDHGSINNMKIDVHALVKALTLKLKTEGKLNDKQPLQIVNTVIVQQADDKVKNNRIKAHERLFSHVISDN